jgi:hypothetical protein
MSSIPLECLEVLFIACVDLMQICGSIKRKIYTETVIVNKLVPHIYQVFSEITDLDQSLPYRFVAIVKIGNHKVRYPKILTFCDFIDVRKAQNEIEQALYLFLHDIIDILKSRSFGSFRIFLDFHKEILQLSICDPYHREDRSLKFDSVSRCFVDAQDNLKDTTHFSRGNFIVNGESYEILGKFIYNCFGTLHAFEGDPNQDFFVNVDGGELNAFRVDHSEKTVRIVPVWLERWSVLSSFDFEDDRVGLILHDSNPGGANSVAIGIFDRFGMIEVVPINMGNINTKLHLPFSACKIGDEILVNTIQKMGGDSSVCTIKGLFNLKRSLNKFSAL